MALEEKRLWGAATAATPYLDFLCMCSPSQNPSVVLTVMLFSHV